MSTTTIILIVAAVVIFALIAVRGAGPRVTQIDRTVRKEKDRGDA